MIGSHPVSIGAAIETGIELGLLQTQLASQVFKRSFCPLLTGPFALALKEQVVHFPVLALLASALGCLGCLLSLRVY